MSLVSTIQSADIVGDSRCVLGRVSSAIFRENMSGEELQDKIKLIDECGSRLTKQANIDSMQRQQDMYEGDQDRTMFMISSARRQDHGFNTVALRQHDLSEGFQRHERKLEALAEALNQHLHLLKASPSPPAGAIQDRRLLEAVDPAVGFGNRLLRSYFA
ncbi:MAG: hypothetical protein Q9207_004073 [Kuettlingeria erythrocarpa]